MLQYCQELSVLSKVSLILLFLSPGRLLEICLRQSQRQVEFHNFEGWLVGFFQLKSLQKYQNYYTVKYCFPPKLGTAQLFWPGNSSCPQRCCLCPGTQLWLCLLPCSWHSPAALGMSALTLLTVFLLICSSSGSGWWRGKTWCMHRLPALL